MIAASRKDRLFIALGGFFIANALLGEMIGGKLISFGPLDLGLYEIGPRIMSIGIIPWPVVFIATDLINEYFGKEGVKKITFLTAGLIIYVFIMLFCAMQVGASPVSPVQDEEFRAVFGQSLWIIVGSIVAFVVSQLIDVSLFWVLRSRTGKRMLWLRSTGSTLVSQLIDTFLVAGIGFYLPGKISFNDYINMALTGYLGKMIVALAMTPIIYLGHALVDRYLGKQAEQTIALAAKESLSREQ